MLVIVDACGGNLRSVARALAAAGGAPIVSSDPAVVRGAERVVIPGQGAFAPFMRGLAERGLGDALRDVLADGTPMLGICLGLQVLFDRSAEVDGHAAARPGAGLPGLGLIAGTVELLHPTTPTAKVPHIGWNPVQRPATAPPEPLLDGIADGTAFYFVHSYAAQPRDPATIALTCDHGGPVVAAVRHRNLFACQFHPEKSQSVGLRLLANFVR